jgi:NAD+ synthase
MNYMQDIKKVSNWMKDYCEKAGTKGYVIGLSGGIDSAVIACLAVKAVGKENVIGVSLPCNSSVDMGEDAELLAKNLDISFKTVNLFDSYKEMIDRLKEAYKEEIQNLTQANLKARLRMTTLYAIANQNNMLVAGTGNLSELMIGYCTKFGDGAVDLEPIGNYYKSEVYLMAALMPEIPESIKTKAPSADLWSGQTDEAEIGMTYAELDTILINLGTRAEDLLGGDKTDKVRNMIKKAEHKNNLPPRYKRV